MTDFDLIDMAFALIWGLIGWSLSSYEAYKAKNMERELVRMSKLLGEEYKVKDPWLFTVLYWAATKLRL